MPIDNGDVDTLPRGGFEARLRFVEQIAVSVNRLLPKIETLIEARSGEQELDRTLSRDLTRAHDKLRDIASRQDRMEARQNKFFWMLSGGFVVVQLLFALMTWVVEHRELFLGVHH